MWFTFKPCLESKPSFWGLTTHLLVNFSEVRIQFVQAFVPIFKVIQLSLFVFQILAQFWYFARRCLLAGFHCYQTRGHVSSRAQRTTVAVKCNIMRLSMTVTRWLWETAALLLCIFSLSASRSSFRAICIQTNPAQAITQAANMMNRNKG